MAPRPNTRARLLPPHEAELADVVLEAVATQVWMVDPELRILANHGRLHRPAGEWIGSNLHEYFGVRPGEPHRAIDGHRRALAGEVVAYRTFAYPSPLDIVLRPVRDVEGEVTAVAGVATDATEAARFHSLVQSLDAIVWECDPVTFAFTFVSDYAETLLGYAPSAWCADPDFWAAHIHPDDRDGVVAACREAIERCEDHRLEYRMLASDGRVVWIRDVVHVECEAPGLAARVCGVMIDITRARDDADRLASTEQRLERSYKLEALGRLAAGVAHDFNNLLTAIRGSAELGRRAEVLDAVDRARILTSQLLTFAARKPADGVPVDINAALREVQGLLRRLIETRVEIVTDLADGLPAALFDRAQLEQVVLNLTLNARDAMPGGGTLTVETALEEDAGERWVAIRVRDTGIGMSPEALEHAFEPFFTTKGDAGTGLGLATVYGAVTQRGGHVNLRSREGEGTEVTVRLPLAERPAVPSPARRPAARAGGDETILLVEDQDLVRELVADVLTGRGYDVHAAEGAEHATALVEDGLAPDLLLADVEMGSTSGVELARRLRLDRPGLRVLFMSGYGGRGVTDGLREAPLLEKPFGTDELAAAVRDALDVR